MNTAYARIFGVALAAVLFVTAVTSQVSAQSAEIEVSRLQSISENCVSIKNTLNQLHASDALLRVNRGQVYESMASRMMDKFNTRLSSNSLDAKATVSVTTGYRTALDTFRKDYQAYERQLSVAIKIDCRENPGLFAVAIDDARSKRKVVHEDVQKLHQYIDDYRSAVGDFLINFERVGQ